MTMEAELETQLTTELPAGEAQEQAAEPEPTIDWKAKFEEVQADRDKIANDLKAIKGLRVPEARREELLINLADRIEAIDLQQVALIRALGDNTTEKLPDEINKIQAESQRTRASRGFDANAMSLWDDLNAAVQDPDGNVILDLQKAPELEEARQIWQAGCDGISRKTMGAPEALAVLTRAVGQANRVAKAELRKRGQAEGKQAREEAQAAIKRQREEDGTLDLDTGPVAGGRSQSFDSLMKKDPYKMNAKELREYRSALEKARR